MVAEDANNSQSSIAVQQLPSHDGFRNQIASNSSVATAPQYIEALRDVCSTSPLSRLLNAAYASLLDQLYNNSTSDPLRSLLDSCLLTTLASLQQATCVYFPNPAP